ncbi:unnamed protein product [Durusdinium trenchii]|uniref:protein-tyrosine-phosphatase n=1 Tax=Durusdinium trenchii TaxID=1381693 RepID=A0ABP0IPQ7_9DINO
MTTAGACVPELGSLSEKEGAVLKDFQSLLRLNLSYIEPLSTVPAELLPHLFLGSRDDAVNAKVLQSLGITHVQHYDLLANLANAVAEKKGRLFVHCEAGVNRSGSLCLAYHAATSGMTLLESAQHCKARRGRICTNPAFQLQVFGFARKHQLPL